MTTVTPSIAEIVEAAVKAALAARDASDPSLRVMSPTTRLTLQIGLKPS